eukprot:987983-Rhodomonas_salina.2
MGARVPRTAALNATPAHAPCTCSPKRIVCVLVFSAWLAAGRLQTGRQQTARGEIKRQKHHSRYKVYGACGVMSLISGR